VEAPQSSILVRLLLSPSQLLHRHLEVCVPVDVNLVANLDLIEHRRIDDMTAIFPAVRTNEGDRRRALVIVSTVALIVRCIVAVLEGSA